jgi:hypothetical protein
MGTTNAQLVNSLTNFRLKIDELYKNLLLLESSEYIIDRY